MAGLVIIGVILFGMIAGGAAQLILRMHKASNIDWPLAFVSGIVGSFVGGFLYGLLSDGRFELRPSGLIGSIIGAIIVTAIWGAFKARRGKAA